MTSHNACPLSPFMVLPGSGKTSSRDFRTLPVLVVGMSDGVVWGQTTRPLLHTPYKGEKNRDQFLSYIQKSIQQQNMLLSKEDVAVLVEYFCVGVS